jgi:LysR family transcriptional activator of nhaA
MNELPPTAPRSPSRINYKHLQYFHAVVREGSVTAAARRLHVAPQTVSAQVRSLERSLGRPLFERAGRRMVLTPDGEVALDYADSIFALGQELRGVMAGRVEARRLVLRLGVTDSVPKLLMARVLDPLFERHRDRLELSCAEAGAAELVGRLASHQLDAVLAETPVPPQLARTLRSRLLLESGLSFMATRRLKASARASFPDCLAALPLLNWPADSTAGSAIDQWLAERGLEPRIVGRCDDSALMKVLAQRGLGAIGVPTSIEKDVARQFDLVALGRVPQLRQTLYLIRPAGRRSHPLLDEIK